MAANSGAEELNLIDEPSVAQTLRVMLLAVLGSALAISAVTRLLRWPLVPQLALVGAASSLVSLGLCRYGRIRPAMFLALLSVTYAVLHAAARNDGIQNIGLAIVPVLIVVGSLLLDSLMLVLLCSGNIQACYATSFSRRYS